MGKPKFPPGAWTPDKIAAFNGPFPRDLDNKPFNADSYNRFKKAHFDHGVTDGEKNERIRIRKAIAPHLKALRAWFGHGPGGKGACPCPNCVALKAIDRATRATRKTKKGAKP